MSKRIAIEFDGMPGEYVLDLPFMRVYARWASSSGYCSVAIDSFTSDEEIHAELRALYEAAKALPWLVGDEHKEFGWKLLWESKYRLPGHWMIRVPGWAQPEVLEVLDFAGFVLKDELNSTWALMHQVDRATVAAALAPILEPGSRLKDANCLARDLRRTVEAHLSVVINQLSLF